MEYYPRKILEKLEKLLERPEILVIRGPRQAGKTSVLRILQDRLKESEYLTFEDMDIRKSFEENPALFMKRFDVGERKVMLMDEVQYIKDAGQKLKLVYDTMQNIKIIATGSSSFELKSQLGKNLVGRLIYFELMPLDFEEFLLWKDAGLHKVFSEAKSAVAAFVESGRVFGVRPVFEGELTKLLSEYLLFGGYPAVVKEKDEEIKKSLLSALRQTYLEKDVFYFFRLRDLSKFDRLMELLSLSMGDMLKISSLSQSMASDFRTLTEYIGILENTFVIRTLRPYFKNPRTELRKARKLYFVDMGMANAVTRNFQPPFARRDTGKVLENFVLNELSSQFGGWEIRYWRTLGKAEVDFVLAKGDEFIPVEVKTRETKIGKSMLSFIKTYSPKRAVVFTLSKCGEEKIGSTRILFAPHFFI